MVLAVSAAASLAVVAPAEAGKLKGGLNEKRRIDFNYSRCASS